MRLFLKRLVFFLILLAVFLPVMDFLFSWRAQESANANIEAWYDLMHGQIEADLVVLGSSRAQSHVVPDILDSILGTNSYNLGQAGTHLDMHLAKYDLYRARNKKPDIIIHCLDIRTLLPQDNVTDREQYFPYFWDREFRNRIFPVIRFTFPERFIPFYRFFWQNVPDLLRSNPKLLERGYLPLYGEWDSATFLKREFSIDERFRQEFERYVEKALREGIRLVFVMPPLYYRLKDTFLGLEEMKRFYATLSEKNRIPLLDYTWMGICRDSCLFNNGLHLNHQGARIFTDSLARDLLKLGITIPSGE